jgi:hypothetical protein
MSLNHFHTFVDTTTKLAVPVGVAIMLWLQSQFVTRVEFGAYNERVDARLGKIETVLIRMESGAEADKRHDALLADHETRIRNMERVTPK